MLASFGGRAARHRPSCRSSRRRRRARRRCCRRAAVRFGLAPGSVWPTKRWDPDGFAGGAATFRDRGARVVVLGAPDERAIAEEVVRRAGGGAAMLAGATDLATLVAVIDRLAVLVANDSAPMHVAGARGVPVVAIFCATTPALGYGPGVGARPS